MTARDMLMAAGGFSQEKLYVDDVFSTYLYTGNGATQTINNGIDLAGKGGMVWIKDRSVGRSHYLRSDSFASHYALRSDQTGGLTYLPNNITSFNSNGFSLQFDPISNNSGENYASWTFRRAPKFFDVVTYTGDGSNVRGVSHSLGSSPGIVIIKATNSVGNWVVLHSSDGAWGAASPYLWRSGFLNSSESMTGNSELLFWMNANTFQVANGSGLSCNASGVSYVAYLFGSDTSTDGLIQCGDFMTDGSGNATISLGWEPQFVLLKAASSAGGWVIVDSMRGMPVGGADAQLYPHASNAEASINTLDPTATGFNATGLVAYASYIYMAIRRPNKPPTSGTQVYNAIERTGTGAPATVTGVGFAPDLAWVGARNISNNGNGGEVACIDRLRGGGALLQIRYAAAEVSGLTDQITSFDMNGVSLGADATYGRVNYNYSINYINWFFRRAAGFFDVVCWRSGGSYVEHNIIQHNLGVPAELIVSKARSGYYGWWVYAPVLGVGEYCKCGRLNESYKFNEKPNAYTVGTFAAFSTNVIGDVSTDHVSYLFASRSGISKVGSYTGNGGSQTINCGFTTGARFILIKRTDADGDWYVWDTVRGIVAANDPHLSLNRTAAEVTTDDSVDPDASGFIVNQVAVTNINVSGGQYLFLAIA